MPSFRNTPPLDWTPILFIRPSARKGKFLVNPISAALPLGIALILLTGSVFGCAQLPASTSLSPDSGLTTDQSASYEPQARKPRPTPTPSGGSLTVGVDIQDGDVITP